MSKKTIMLVCSAGMSTSMLVARMDKAAEADGLDVDIFATGSAGIAADVAEHHPDVMMLGPQVRFMADQLAKQYPMPVKVINMQDYGQMKGENVLRDALATIEAAES
ncbi:PTS sugar transporter subunit IIB [Lacticaseibacillus nasuensis]|uniref:PTS EIIB type-3 domain-containing protein n=1 Tax=Lacticaseibacillus nasuensis JCM 17158 TaxID=1291734 RepID=A0A0R1JGW9_9LACO|nr:PTS sugar transporter subunit IIB [Lacticaseibacillus nasuensis]KRK70534.1 hypothetical protein FD02_GL000605 [Lacticaseibacillus nasuensis JCM 17158]MCX2456246.1 PTS sugar transporter subunit IIB [Lacticaseibacillus nasuensis]